MCGIVGAVAERNIVPILLEGLRRLEYRGYDSCGIAYLEQSLNGAEHVELKRLRSIARVGELTVRAQAVSSLTGIAHTRWATHGAPSEGNAHPHFSRNEIGVVHNGIIENFESLRAKLMTEGYDFQTQTDSEVIAQLVHSHYQGHVLDAVQATVREMVGAFAIAVVTVREPNRLVGARAGRPMVAGLGDPTTGQTLRDSDV